MSMPFPTGRKASRRVANFRAHNGGGSRTAPAAHAMPISIHSQVKVQTVRELVGRRAGDGPGHAQRVGPRGCSGRLHNRPSSTAAGAQEHHCDEDKPKPTSSPTFPRPGECHATTNFLEADSGELGIGLLQVGRLPGVAGPLMITKHASLSKATRPSRVFAEPCGAGCRDQNTFGTEPKERFFS